MYIDLAKKILIPCSNQLLRLKSHKCFGLESNLGFGGLFFPERKEFNPFFCTLRTVQFYLLNSEMWSNYSKMSPFFSKIILFTTIGNSKNVNRFTTITTLSFDLVYSVSWYEHVIINHPKISLLRSFLKRQKNM